MDFGNICFSMKPQEIHYTEAILSQLAIREVHDGEYPNGIYHIKPIGKVNLKFLVDFLKKEIPRAEIEIIDVDGDINLEYPIYMISNDDRKNLVQNIQIADDKLDKFIKNREKGAI